MEHYIEVKMENLKKDQIDILIALLAEIGYEGFEEEKDQLKAYILRKNFQAKQLKSITGKQNISFGISEIENRNWNQEWESEFQPVIIDDFVAIRAHFHAPVKNVRHDIIITPKMSFGTGHHATTSMMIKMMVGLEFDQKKVFDFGTGTGILAILAEKLGASKILAIDNDDWSLQNAKENLEINHCTRIQLAKASSPPGQQQFDILLVNIIRKVIVENLPFLVKQMIPGASLLISGILSDDEPEILKLASDHHLVFMKRLEQRDWICLLFSHD